MSGLFSSVDVIKHESSFVAYCDQAMKPPVNAVNRSLYTSHYSQGRVSFNGLAEPLPEVKRILLGGWPDGVDKVQKAGEKLRLPALKSIRRKVRFGAQGDELDIHAVRNGRLDRAWRSAPRQLTSGPIRVHLVVNMSANCGVNSRDLPWRGAAGLALAKVLTGAGYSVKITAAVTNINCDDRGGKLFWFVTVKDYHQPLNVTALAAAVAHPASFRRIGFTYICQASKGHVRSTLGFPYTPSEAELREALGAQAHDIVLEVPQQTLSESAARAWLATVPEKLGAL